MASGETVRQYNGHHKGLFRQIRSRVLAHIMSHLLISIVFQLPSAVLYTTALANYSHSYSFLTSTVPFFVGLFASCELLLFRGVSYPLNSTLFCHEMKFPHFYKERHL